MIRVVVAMPILHDVKAGTALDLAMMVGHTVATTPEIKLRLTMPSGTLLPSSRQGVVLEAIAREDTHILWLDSDMRFPLETLLHLLEHDRDIVSANYVTRRWPIAPTTMQRAGESGLPHRIYTTDQHGLEDVDFIGFGCVLTKVEVFQQLPRPWFHLLYRKETESFAGEDTFFCHHVRHHGLTIQIDHDLSRSVKHIGDMEFTHEHADALVQQRRETADVH